MFVDLDVSFGASGNNLKQIYWKPQSSSGGGFGINNDREVVQAMFEAQAKKEIFKTFFNTLNTSSDVRNKSRVVSTDVAPIITRVRFKTADLGSPEEGKWFLAEPKNPRNDYITNFIPDIKLPVWFVNNDLNTFLKTFYDKLDEVKIPEKVGFLGK